MGVPPMARNSQSPYPVPDQQWLPVLDSMPDWKFSSWLSTHMSTVASFVSAKATRMSPPVNECL